MQNGDDSRVSKASMLTVDYWDKGKWEGASDNIQLSQNRHHLRRSKFGLMFIRCEVLNWSQTGVDIPDQLCV